VPGAGAHVEQLLHGRAAEGRGLQVRDDALDRRGDVERAAAGQHSGDEAGDGLGDRYEQVPAPGRRPFLPLRSRQFALLRCCRTVSTVSRIKRSASASKVAILGSAFFGEESSFVHSVPNSVSISMRREITTWIVS
jgi:hypothetical protein